MIYAKEKNYTLYKGKMQDVLDTLEENSIDSIVCDPPYELNFMGSGSTGKAVMFENRERNANYYFIGVEMTEEYLPICKARIDYALNKYEFDFQKQLQDEKDKGQLSIFDFME